MNIDDIYQLVQTFSNKEQRGFVTSGDFNLLAKKAQMEIIKERLDIIRSGVQLKVAGANRYDVTPTRAKQDLSYILTKATLVYANNLFTIPTDNLHLVELMYQGINPIDVVDDHSINYLLRSTIASPSTDNPVALMYGGNIEVFPTAITSGVTAKYYKEPAAPIWAYVSINTTNNPIYDDSNSTQFVLPATCHNELIIKILGYVGVNLRDVDIVSYSQNKDAVN